MAGGGDGRDDRGNLLFSEQALQSPTLNYALGALGFVGGIPANQQQTISTCLSPVLSERGTDKGFPGAPLITQEAAAQWTDPGGHGVPGRNSSSQRILLPDP